MKQPFMQLSGANPVWRCFGCAVPAGGAAVGWRGWGTFAPESLAVPSGPSRRRRSWRHWLPAASSRNGTSRAGRAGPLPAASAATRSGVPAAGCHRRKPRRPLRHPPRRPGAGPAAQRVRCTSVLVTGDMLVHAQLWQQARDDAAAAEASRAGLRPAAGRPAALHPGRATSPSATRKPRWPCPEGPFSAYPSFNVPPQIIAAVQGRGLPGLHHRQQPHHRPGHRRTRSGPWMPWTPPG